MWDDVYDFEELIHLEITFNREDHFEYFNVIISNNSSHLDGKHNFSLFVWMNEWMNEWMNTLFVLTCIR